MVTLLNPLLAQPTTLTEPFVPIRHVLHVGLDLKQTVKLEI